MKMALITIAAVVVVLVAAIIIAGLLLPRTSEASRSVLLPVPPDQAFAKVADPAGQAS